LSAQSNRRVPSFFFEEKIQELDSPLSIFNVSAVSAVYPKGVPGLKKKT